MPPEVMTQGRITTATDIYSFGMLMYELAACRLAFRGHNAAQIFYMVVHQVREGSRGARKGSRGARKGSRGVAGCLGTGWLGCV